MAEAGVKGNFALVSWYIVLVAINTLSYEKSQMECAKNVPGGCSGAFMGTPGVFESSIISGSGGIADPSILSWLALTFARCPAMASKLGIFLYPTYFFGGSWEEPVSSLSFSNFSVVNGSPPSTILVPAVALLCMDALLAAGETDRVLGGLTAVESAAEAAVLTLVVDPGPVRRANAAKRGRGAEVVLGWRTGRHCLRHARLAG